MKLLLFSDLHGDMKQLRKLIMQAKNADAVLCAGDMSVFEQDLKEILEKFREFQVPVFVIPGNHEDEESISVLCEDIPNVHDVHMAAVGMKNLIVIGHGGGGFSHTSPEFQAVSSILAAQVRKHKKRYADAHCVLMTHQPPYKTRPDTIFDEHTGNKDYRKFIMRYQPDIALCGHIHETAGTESILKKTRVINPGPAGVFVDL